MPADFTGYVGKPLTFSGTGTGGDTRTIVSWEWDFGDGTTATGQTVQHTYSQPGTYTVTLTVTNDCGGQATATHTVEILTLQSITIHLMKGATYIGFPMEVQDPLTYFEQQGVVAALLTWDGNNQSWVNVADFGASYIAKPGIGYVVEGLPTAADVVFEAPQFVSLTWDQILQINGVQFGVIGKPWWLIATGIDPVNVPTGYRVLDPMNKDPTTGEAQPVDVMQPLRAYWLYIPENVCPTPTADFTVQQL